MGKWDRGRKTAKTDASSSQLPLGRLSLSPGSSGSQCRLPSRLRGSTQGQRAGFNTYQPWLRAAPGGGLGRVHPGTPGCHMGGKKCPASGWKGTECTAVLRAQDLKTDTQSLWNKWGSLRHRSQQKRRQFHACPALLLPSSQYLGFKERERVWECVYVWVWRAFEFSGFSSAVWNVWGETR